MNSNDKPTAGLPNLILEIERLIDLDELSQITTILAVSGGADSVAMTHLMKKLAPTDAKFVIAHFNHRWRGNESDRDEAFVRELADNLGWSCFIGTAERIESTGLESSMESNQGIGKEAIARNERYHFLQETAKNVGARMVATAHTLEDQAETMIQRFFRGSSLAGLSGIRPVRLWFEGVSLVRPLLGCSKSNLEQYLAEIQQPYCEDSSNRSTEFTRNRIRHELLPLTCELFGNDPVQTLGATAEHFSEIVEAWDEVIQPLLDDLIQFTESKVIVPLLLRITELHDVFLNELWKNIWIRSRWPLRDMNRKKWKSITQLVRNSSEARINLPGNILVDRTESELTFSSSTD